MVIIFCGAICRGRLLAKKDEKKRVVRYQHPKKQQYIHVAEMLVTNVALDENLSMDIYEYQSIFNAVL